MTRTKGTGKGKAVGIVAAAVLVGATLADPVAAQGPAPRRAEADRLAEQRYRITQMENALTSAVRHAAEGMGRRLQALTPGVVFLSGAARARGFVLPDYGVFFDVEVPALPLSVAWTLRVMTRDLDLGRSLQVIRDVLRSLPETERREAEQALRRIELGVGPAGPPADAPPAASPTRGAPAVQAATVLPLPPGAAAGAGAAAPPSRDVDEDYTEVVKGEIIDAMLEYSRQLALGPDAWLVVAARDSAGPVAPGEIYDAMTIVLRIKGSDLAAFHAGRLSKEEARKRVDIHEF
jgi:hypothetical protein